MGTSSEEKKKKERVRNAKRRMMLHSIRGLLKEFGVEGNKRWTEHRTLKQALELIAALKASVRDHGGNLRHVPLPMAFSKGSYRCKCMSC